MNGFSKIGSFYLLTKPLTAIIPLTALVVGTVVATESFTMSLEIISGCISLLIVFMGSCVIDGIGDREIDRQFHPNEPLVTKSKSGKVSVGSATALTILLFAIGLSVAFVMLGAKFVLVMTIFPVLAILYSIKPRITDWGLIGNLTFIFFSVSLPFLAGVVIVDKILPITIFTSIILLLLGTGLDLVKDFVKYYEDKETKRRSILETLGVNTGTKFIAMSSIFPYILSPVLLVLLNLSIVSLFFMIVLCFLLIVLSGELMLSKPPESRKVAKQMHKKNNALMILAYGSIEMFLLSIAVGLV